jgi:hypothetical protein
VARPGGGLLAVRDNRPVLEAELKDDAYVVRTDDPVLGDALAELGFAPAGTVFVRRFEAPTREVFGRFERHLPALLAQAARRERPPWEDALATVAARLGDEGWFLCGSAAIAVRGVDVTPRDVDFMAASHEAARRALADLLIEPPVETTRSAFRWFGRAFAGARIEWAAEPPPDTDERWVSEIGPAAAARLDTVEWRGHRLRVPPLDLQVAVSRARGLDDRVAALLALEH